MQERCQAAKESHDGACAAARAAKIPTIWGCCGSSRCGVGWRVAGWRWQVAAKYARYATYSFLFTTRAQPCVP